MTTTFPRVTVIISFAGAAITFVCAVAWIASHALQPTASSLRGLLLAMGLLAAATSVLVVLGRQRDEARAVQRWLERLCALDLGQVSADDLAGGLPYLPPTNSWSALTVCVREKFLAACQQRAEFEHARATLEVRVHNATLQQERVRAILADLPDPIVAIDEFDDLVFANRRAEDLFDFESLSSEGRALSHVIQCQRLVDLLSEVRSRGTATTRSENVEVADRAGGTHAYTAAVSTIASGNGRCDSTPEGESRGVVLVLRNADDERAVQRRNAAFVSAASHEMKTPLASIKAYVELLVDGDADDDATREECLEVIAGQAERLQRLIDNLLNLARIEACVTKVSKQKQPLNDLLHEALRIVRPAADARSIELVDDLSPMYLGVHIDRDMMLQAVINLLSNAVKYTPEDGRVTIRSRMTDRQVRIDVEDTGVGLSADNVNHVFERFYRVQSSSEMASGTGLGLPLVKQIVEDVHGGTVAVASQLGHGSTFTIVLPSASEIR